ncbi:hypothetical protein ACNPQK_18590 [Acinetobacter guillouiae]|uniref:hypothetical protein n=1 Tax=Acinetobacter guillouiae TaxID=106649 RepID=UPI003AF64BBB
MSESQLVKEIEKIKFQLSHIGLALDGEKYPIPSLIVSMDWSEQDLEDVHKIFEKYDDLIESNSNLSWGAFESDLKKRFGVTYQGIKPIIKAFYKNGQWVDVCIAYAKEHQCIEFDEITKAN